MSIQVSMVDCKPCLAGEESQCYEYGIIGDSVPSGLAEYIAVDATNTLKLPKAMSFEDAAAPPLLYQTAWRALITKARIRPDYDVLLLGTSGANKTSKARQMGADIILNRKSGDCWREIARSTNNRGILY